MRTTRSPQDRQQMQPGPAHRERLQPERTCRKLKVRKSHFIKIRRGGDTGKSRNAQGHGSERSQQRARGDGVYAMLRIPSQVGCLLSAILRFALESRVCRGAGAVSGSDGSADALPGEGGYQTPRKRVPETARPPTHRKFPPFEEIVKAFNRPSPMPRRRQTQSGRGFHGRPQSRKEAGARWVAC